jgi:predicted nucleotidyltransferase
MTAQDAHRKLSQEIASLFQVFPNVEAIALGGSLTSGFADPASDIDLYVFTTSVIPLAQRTVLVETAKAGRKDLNLQIWDLGDEWFDAETGIEVDVIYWDTNWTIEQLERVVLHHKAALGYSTSFWHTIRSAEALYDRKGWFSSVKQKANAPYPEELRRAIISLNYPVLRQVIPGYAHQIEKALRRGDLVSLNHRVAALLASYFDVVFALNRVLNPGEKRLLYITPQICSRLPRDMIEQVEGVLRAAGNLDQSLPGKVDLLVDNLERLLVEEGFSLQPIHPSE